MLMPKISESQPKMAKLSLKFWVLSYPHKSFVSPPAFAFVGLT